MEQYKIVDTEQVYMNGAELIPIFRMKQWLEHADAVPVVRCKDCKHYKKSEVAERYMCYRKDVEGWSVCYDFMPTDFCNYGERRTDETD